MDNNDLIQQTRESHENGQEKYTYFLLAAAGAAIGFAVQKTEGLLLSWWLLPVALSIVCWGVSFYFGCKNITWVQASKGANYNLLRLHNDSHPEQPSNEGELLGAVHGVKSALSENMKKAQFCYEWQFRSLVMGAVFFIGWRIAEMVRISCFV
jgi:hypothetical protein